MKRTALTRRTPLETRTGLDRRAPLTRNTPLKAVPTSPRPGRLRRTPLGRTTPEQKARVAGLACIVCRTLPAGGCHPAHVVPRGHPKMSAQAADDVRAVVPLCFNDHLLFDDGGLDLTPYLEPHWRDAQEWAAGAVGLASALRSITGGAA